VATSFDQLVRDSPVNVTAILRINLKLEQHARADDEIVKPDALPAAKLPPSAFTSMARF
jgi:hypothetical protein